MTTRAHYAQRNGQWVTWIDNPGTGLTPRDWLPVTIIDQDLLRKLSVLMLVEATHEGVWVPGVGVTSSAGAIAGTKWHINNEKYYTVETGE